MSHLLFVWAGGVPVWLAALSAMAISGGVWRLSRQSAGARREVRPSAEAETPQRSTNIGEAILARLPDPVMVIDDGGRIAHANLALLDVFPHAVPGRLLSAVVRTPALLESVRGMSQGGAQTELEFTIPPPDNRVFRTFVLPLEREGPGDAPYVLVLIHDVTAARQVDRVRVDFIANASHELRTPLASLSGFIETLRGPAKDDLAAHEKFLEIMEAQAERMKHLIDDLLSLSRVEIDEHVRPSGTVNIGHILGQVLDGLRPLADEAHMEINLTAPTDLPTTAGSQHELSQVFTNLIDNAIKYGRTGKVVDVSAGLEPARIGTGTSQPHIVVQVRDYGEGIPQTDIPRLTERFYRVNPERSRQEGGTGLGLAIVKHTINRHKGQLEIESEIGKGSTFKVLIPVTTDSSAERSIESSFSATTRDPNN